MTTEEEALIINNLGMAYDIAWQFYRKFGYYAEFDDFKSEALLGLTRASITFDNKLNLAFSTYAYKVIQNQLWNFLRQFIRKKDITTKTISIYTETCNEGNSELIDILANDIDIENNMLESMCLAEVQAAINMLPTRLKTIIELKLKGMTMVDIGKQLNLSQSQISRDYHYAINRLKTKLKYWR